MGRSDVGGNAVHGDYAESELIDWEQISRFEEPQLRRARPSSSYKASGLRARSCAQHPVDPTLARRASGVAYGDVLHNVALLSAFALQFCHRLDFSLNSASGVSPSSVRIDVSEGLALQRRLVEKPHRQSLCAHHLHGQERLG